MSGGSGADGLENGTGTAAAADCTRDRIRVGNLHRELTVERHLRRRRVALPAAARWSHSDPNGGAVNGAARRCRLTAIAAAQSDSTAHRTRARERRPRRAHERAGARMRARVLPAADADRQSGHAVDTRRRLRWGRRGVRVARRGAAGRSSDAAETALRAARTRARRRAAFARRRRVGQTTAAATGAGAGSGAGAGRVGRRRRRRHVEAIERRRETDAGCVRCSHKFGHLRACRQ